jgi:hypothetical protein
MSNPLERPLVRDLVFLMSSLGFVVDDDGFYSHLDAFQR